MFLDGHSVTFSRIKSVITLSMGAMRNPAPHPGEGLLPETEAWTQGAIK
jgi:hypothetical protein